MDEIELKFLADERATRRLKARLRELGLGEGREQTRALRSVYFDTAGGDLRAAGFALRLRRDGRRWLQTLKRRRDGTALLSRVDEHECAAPGGRLDLAAIPDEAARDEVLLLVGGQTLAPVCGTSIRRSARLIDLGDGTRAELALDVGEITAGELSVPFREVEIELVEGQPGALYDLARRIVPQAGLRFSHLSKAERGHLLAGAGTIGTEGRPRGSEPVALTADMTAEQAAQASLRECFAQVALNVDACRDGDAPEGPHQLRVGLRRLRSAFAVFAPAIGSPEMERLGDEARWLGREVGLLRDLDVALADILAPEAERHPAEAGFPRLADALAPRIGATRRQLRETLAGARAQEFLVDLARFVETRGWLMPGDIDQTRRLAMPVRELAREALDRRWKAVGKRARRLRDLDVEARHALRKELKTLRYSVEFLGPLFAKKRVAPFVRRLKDLQEAFGDLNDAAMAQALFSGDAAPARDDPAAQRASGWIIGARLARADLGWTAVQTLWTDLEEQRRFWR